MVFRLRPLLLAAIILSSTTAFGQTSIPLNTIVTQDFNSIGTSATASLPANWRMSPSGNSVGAWSAGVATTTIAASSGLPSTGGRYNWATSSGSDRSIGFLTTAGYATPNAVMAYYRNTTGASVSSFTIAFGVERYVVNTGSFSLTLESSTDGIAWTPQAAGNIAAGVFASGANAGSFANPQTFYRTATVNVTVANNADIYFRWTFNTTNTNSQGLGLDNVSIFAGTATPVLTAQLRDILQVDNGVPFQFNIGDVIRYQTVIKNTGTADATNVQINIPPPSNTTLVPGSIKTSALARDDNYTTNVSTPLTGQNVLSNDFGIPSPTVVSFGPSNNSGASAAGATGSSDNGGTVVLNANGTFTYTPPSGFTGEDKFSYIATTGNAPNNEAVVAINVGTAAAAPANDSYSAIGNVSISLTAPSGVLSNDPGTGLFVATVNGSAANVGVATTTAQGGNITVNSDGSFTYNPPKGFEGADNFTYTNNNGFSSGTGSGTVTLNVSGMIWFINAAAAAGGDGRLSAPFNTIAAFQALNNGAAGNPAAGDNVFIYENAAAYASSSINLLQNQKLIGQDATIPLAGAGSITGYTTQSYMAALPAMNTGAPSTNLSNTATIITLATAGGNVVRGLTLTTSAGSALTLSGVATNNHSLADLITNVSGTAVGVNLSPTSYSGTFDYLNGAISNTGTGTAFNVTNAQGTTNINATITQSGNGIMVAVTNAGGGTITFTNTLNATNGTGLQFDNADGTYNFNGTNTLNGGDAGIDIINGSGGSFSFSSNTTITNPGGTAFNVNGTVTTVTANVTYSGSMTQNTAAQRLININTTGSGTITFQTGTLTGGASSTGVNLNAVNGNVTFSNGLVLGTGAARMTSQAITITGGSGTYGLGALSVFTTGVAGLVATNADGTINAAGTIDATTASAINIAGPAGLTSLGMTFTTVNSTGGTNNVNFTNCGGTVTINAGSLTGTAAGATFNVSGGTVSTTYSGAITQAANAVMVSVSGGHATGTVTFQTGTLNATNGTGLQFDNADGTYNFNGTVTLNGADAGVDIINGSGGNFSFNNTNITNPTGAAFFVNGGGGSIGHTGTISKTSAGRLIDIQSRTGGSVTFNGNLSSTTSSTGMNVSSCTGGTITFGGTTKTFNTGTNTAITLATNTGCTINFTNGGLDIDVTTGTGFSATGGGTISISGTGNHITAGTGRAVNIDATTIGGTGITLQDVSATGAATNTINLRNAGTGGFTITGVGTTAGSGGVINHVTAGTTDESYSISTHSFTPNLFATGIGIYINNTSNISISNMNFTGAFGNFAIRGETVNNFTLKESNFTGTYGTSNSGDKMEGAIRFGVASDDGFGNGLTGTAQFLGNNIAGAFTHTLTIFNNNTGSLNISFADASVAHQAIFGNNATTTGDDAILIETRGNGGAKGAGFNLTFSAVGVDFNGARGDLLQTVALSNSTHNITITNNNFKNMHPNIVSGGGGITVGGGSNVSNIVATYNISNNAFTGAVGSAMYVGFGSQGGDITGVIANNTVGTANGTFDVAQNLAGTTGAGLGIWVSTEKYSGSGILRHAVRIEGNTVTDVKDAIAGIALRANSQGGGTCLLEATVKNNIVRELGGTGQYAAFYTIVGGAGLSDNATMGLNITGNTFNNTTITPGTFAENGVVFDQISQLARYYFPGYAGSANGEGYPGGTAGANLSTFLQDATHLNVITNGNFPTRPGKVFADPVFGVLGTLFTLPVP